MRHIGRYRRLARSRQFQDAPWCDFTARRNPSRASRTDSDLDATLRQGLADGLRYAESTRQTGNRAGETEET